MRARVCRIRINSLYLTHNLGEQLDQTLSAHNSAEPFYVTFPIIRSFLQLLRFLMPCLLVPTSALTRFWWCVPEHSAAATIFVLTVRNRPI